jgi:hypothetical protein
VQQPYLRPHGVRSRPTGPIGNTRSRAGDAPTATPESIEGDGLASKPTHPETRSGGDPVRVLLKSGHPKSA